MACTILSRGLSLALLAAFVSPAVAEDKPRAADPNAAVSYYKQVRPIFQAQCQGCHQPAKSRGDYVMTEFDKLLAGGASGNKAVVARDPAKSHLLGQITPRDGKAEMPPDGKKPLNETDIELVRKWIAQGAIDDTPVNARVHFDADHPPVYTRPPVITALDYSPDGKVLAVAGFHEVLLTDPEQGKLTGRLIGLAERVQAVKFSPSGEFLAVAGGQPGRMGEVQIWNVAKKKLQASIPVGFDTLYGVAWSPDGKMVSVGCPDNTVRAFDAARGEQVLQQGAHNDWPLGTVFNKDGTHLVSVGRDMTAKLTEVATQRFIDNITSITPGALKGGIQAVDRHPGRDEIVVGGADGTPKVYRLFRTTARQIGDDANLIRNLPPMTGRVFSVAVSRDGKRVAAGSALDNKGQVFVYSYELDPKTLERIRALEAKKVGQRTPAEKAELVKLKSAQPNEVTRSEVPTAGVYAVAFRPDAAVVAAAGGDGTVRVFDTETGAVVKEYAPAPLAAAGAAGAAAKSAMVKPPEETLSPETLPAGAAVAVLDVQPRAITLGDPFEYAQLVVTAQLASGDTADVTRMAQYQLSGPVVEVDRLGVVRPLADGQATLTVQAGGKSVSLPVAVAGLGQPFKADFVRHVNPVLSRLGCNQGTCHGSAQGKNGFKLSLRGYDPLFDVRALTDDLASRRVNVAAPDDSLMLLKSTGAVPHVGQQLTRPGEPYYETMKNWIASGAKLDAGTPKVTKIEVNPVNPVVQQLGARQQVRVLATYADGRVRDVTREAYLESGNPEVATADRRGIMTAVRRGEAPVLARYEGAYAATTLTVMGDRSGFSWKDPPVHNKIDELTAAKWKRLKIQPSEPCGDQEFLRRVYLDLTGLAPTADEVRAFLADKRDSRVKRDEVVDRLVGSKEYVEYWTNKWADLLQVNRKFLGTEGSAAFRKWIRDEVAANTPYDQFVRKVLTATGSNKDNPAASYFKILRDPAATMENTTHLFLAVRFNCNKCHDHPFERWTQDQYYQTASFFAQMGLKADPAAGDKKVGGTAVEGAKPLYEVIFDTGSGDIKHDRTGAMTPPTFPFPAAKAPVKPAKPEAKPDAKPDAKPTRRQEMAAWITAPDNPYFARSYVNRIWGYLFGVGIIEPIDDIRAGNPPTNPELLDYLAAEFMKSGFDVRHVQRLICKSRTYQASLATNKWNEDDKTNFSHALARRLPAEVLYDTVNRAVGSVSRIPGVPPGTRAAELPDAGVELPSGFLAAFGRPVRESACECERSSGLQLGPVMALINGQTIAEAIGDPNNDLARLVAKEKDDARLINELFLRILNRPATEAEIKACVQALAMPMTDHQSLTAALKTREAEVAPLRAKQEKEREAAIARARTELSAHEKEIAPKVAQAEKDRAARIAAAQGELKKYDTELPGRLAAWSKGQGGDVEWTVLKPRTLTAAGGAKLTVQPDGSVFAEGPNARGAYTFVADTDLTGITAVRLEVLPDERLPKAGPGRAPDGNFVLNQLTLKAEAKSDAKQTKAVGLHNAKASFNQDQFNVAAAVDGNVNAGKGWAISPQFGLTHWAVFETKEAVGFAGGTQLTFTFVQDFNSNQHQVGRFRLSVARAKPPVGLGLAEVYRKTAETPADKRDPKQAEALVRHVKATDPQFAKLQKALADANQPLPVDPKLTALKDALAYASRPVAEDARLAQLRSDVEVSGKQIAQARLTGAQDVAWALINSPAFLFNR